MSKHGKKIFFALLAVSVAVAALYCLRCYYSLSGFLFRLVVKSVFTALRIGFGFFRVLFAKSLIFIWFPVLSYLAISLFTKTRFARTVSPCRGCHSPGASSCRCEALLGLCIFFCFSFSACFYCNGSFLPFPPFSSSG
jgi:hypothetical protein